MRLESSRRTPYARPVPARRGRGPDRIAPRTRRLPFGLLLSVVALAAGCSRSRPPNILVIVVDTLRADHVDVDGNGRNLTPFLASLADQGTVFRNAYAQSSWTLPSVASLWTARYPSQHNVTTAASLLAAAEVTLAEVLHDRGYVTGGFSANTLVTKGRGFAQGFDRYDAYWEDRTDPPRPLDKESADRVNQRALTWLDAHWRSGAPAAPVFLYLQYMEPHAPYFPPPEVMERVISRRADADSVRRTYQDMLSAHPERWNGADPAALEVIRTAYDAEVESLDGHIRNLFTALAARGFLQHAIVVVTADHGEELHDHGELGHCRTLYDELIRVPLLVLDTTRHERHDVRDIVSLIDVAPTVLTLAGIPLPAAFEGHALSPQRATPPSAVADAPVAYSELLRFPTRSASPCRGTSVRSSSGRTS